MNNKSVIMSILSSFLILIGCSSNYPPLEVVQYVDLDKYLGKWYEIAAFPQSFQKGCNCSTAEYFKTDEGYIRVLNTCKKGSPDGETKTADGKAWVVDKTTNAKLEVSFFWPFKGDYWIIELAQDYSYAVVGHPNREYLWILCREKTINESIYNTLIEKIKNKGFDITKIIRTNQACQ